MKNRSDIHKNAVFALGAAVIACSVGLGDAKAQTRPVVVSLQVSSRGVDLKTPAGAREMYQRVKNAAWYACTRANRVGLAPSPDPDACADQAVGEAIRSANVPLLTQVYLETHSVQQAAAHGIDVPVKVAAK